MIHVEDLRDEADLVWVEDPSQFRFVREELISWAIRRTGPLRRSGARVVGYANLHPSAHRDSGHCFPRRLFWLRIDPADTEITRPGDVGGPGRPVAPSSLVVGIPGSDWEVPID